MNLMQDLRFAVRLLIKDKWFTAVAVIALALGIGVNATVFTFVNAVLIRGLPFNDPDRILVVGTRDARGRDRGASYQDFEDWRAATRDVLGARRVQRSDHEHQRRGPRAGAVPGPLHFRERLHADRTAAAPRPRFPARGRSTWRLGRS